MMKLFAIGNYCSYGTFALVMAESAKEAFRKLESLNTNDHICLNQRAEKYDMEIAELLKYKNIEEVSNGIFISEHE